MKKDAYYFPHYCNSRHDRKIKRVIKQLGVEGYGIYFMLLEVLREQTDYKYPLVDIDLLSDEFRTSEEKVRTVINNYELFDVDNNNMFFSIKLIQYLQPYIEKSERARLAANKRWDKAKLDANAHANAHANALPGQSTSNAHAMQGEERRVKETKVKEINKNIGVVSNNHNFINKEITMCRTKTQIINIVNRLNISDDKKQSIEESINLIPKSDLTEDLVSCLIRVDNIIESAKNNTNGGYDREALLKKMGDIVCE